MREIVTRRGALGIGVRGDIQAEVRRLSGLAEDRRKLSSHVVVIADDNTARGEQQRRSLLILVLLGTRQASFACAEAEYQLPQTAVMQMQVHYITESPTPVLVAGFLYDMSQGSS